MRVFVANFGLKNYEWHECLERGTIAVMNHPDHHRLWKDRDLAGFIASGLKHRNYKGKSPNRSVVERWYAAADIFAESQGDLWIHRHKDEV